MVPLVQSPLIKTPQRVKGTSHSINSGLAMYLVGGGDSMPVTGAFWGSVGFHLPSGAPAPHHEQSAAQMAAAHSARLGMRRHGEHSQAQRSCS